MTRARDFADVISGQFDLPAGSLDNTEVVDDATPQLGGNLDTNGNNIAFGDSDEAQFGDSADGEIFHNGSHFIIRETNASGNMLMRGNSIYFESSDGSEQYATFTANGAINLKHDNDVKLATTTSGIDVTGVIDVQSTSGTSTDVAKFEAAIGSYTGTTLVAANTLSPASTYNLFECVTDSDGDASGPFTEFLVRGDGKVGIGEDSPLGTLHVRTSDASITSVNANADDLIVENNGNCGVSIASSPSGQGNLNFIDSGDTNIGRIQYTHSDNNMIFRTGDGERMRVDGGGKIQLNGNNGSLSSDTYFQVNVNGGNGDDAYMAIACNGSNIANQDAGIYFGRTNNRIYTTVDGSGNFRDEIIVLAGNSGGVKLGSGGTSWQSASDENLKTIIENITGALDDVKTLRTVIGRYDWDADDKRRSFLIAQDVQAVLPEVVDTDADDNLMLDYTGVIPLLTAALKEAITKIETLETQVADLTTRVAALEAAE